MKVAELVSNLEKTYQNHFPNSRISVRYSSGFYRSLYVRCFLANDNSEVSGGSWDNDVLSVGFMLDLAGNEFPKGTTPETELSDSELTLASNTCHYTTNPTVQYNIYGHKKAAFRKKSGNAEKIVKEFDVFCGRLHDSLCESLKNGEIHPNHIQLVERKVN